MLLSHWRRGARVGYGELSIKINGGICLAGGTNPASSLNGNTVLAIFYLKEPPYRCSITVQPCKEVCFLHVYKLWVTYPCKRQSLFSHIIFDHRGQFDRTQFEGYCIYRADSFFMKIHIVYFKTVPEFFDARRSELSLLRRKWTHRRERYLIQIMK